MDGEQLIEYAVQKFQEEQYDEALAAFILAYSKGYEQEWILENIYACYVQGNEPAFREAFEKHDFDIDIPYEECTLDFIPCNDGEYYVFDKEQRAFCGKFSIGELEAVEPGERIKKIEFSGAAFEMDGYWHREQIRQILADAKNRKTVAVCHDMKKGASYWKIPELEPYMRNILMFPDYETMQEYYHKHTSVYLPKLVFGDNARLNEIFAEEHAYRLTPEGRNTDNVLLTIAIPTANRGNLLIRRMENLLKMVFDAEIEIVVSKNGTVRYEEEYKKVGETEDARLIYYDHKKDLRYYHNWHYAVEMAHGRYVLFVSDEDDVNLGALEHYLKLLQEHPEVSVIRAKCSEMYSFITEREYAEKGRNAFLSAFLAQNYLSGLIVRRDAFMEADLLSLDKYMENLFYFNYPHEWWVAMLCRAGVYMEEPEILIFEGKEAEEVGGSGLKQYATYEERLKQMGGQIEFVKLYCGQDEDLKAAALNKVFRKIAGLFQLARNNDYDVENYEYWIDEFVRQCMEVVDAEITEQKKADTLLLQIYCDVGKLLDEHNRKIELEKEAEELKQERYKKGGIYFRKAEKYFEDKQYDKAVEDWIYAYKCGYNKAQILENIYSNFVIPNTEGFKENYELNRQEETCSYDDCVLDFIPVSDKKFYIFDREKQEFQGHICLEDNWLGRSSHKFAGKFYTDTWDIRKIQSADEQKPCGNVWLLLDEFTEPRFYSFFKLPDFREKYMGRLSVFHDVESLEEFFVENMEWPVPGRIFSCNRGIGRKLLKEIEEKKISRIKEAGGKNFLLLKGQSQYGALRRMVEEMGAQLRRLGHNTIVIDLLLFEDIDDILKFVNKLKEKVSFDAVIAYNGMAIETGVVQDIGKKFIAVMGDHPIWHSKRLECADENILFSFGDTYNIKFIKKYFPKVRLTPRPIGGAATFLPERCPYAERRFDLVFTGGYNDPEMVYKEAFEKLKGDDIFNTINNCIRKLIEKPNLTYEGALEETLNDMGIHDLKDEEFLNIAKACVDVNRYIRAYFRDKIIRTIINSGIKIHVSGNGWENFKSVNRDNLIEEHNDWYTGKKLIANAKITLNVMPWFKGGGHDRVGTAMMSGSVLLTDTNEFFEKAYKDMEDIALFRLDHLEELPGKIRWLLENEEKAAAIAEAGYQKVKPGATGNVNARVLLSQLAELSGETPEQQKECIKPGADLLRVKQGERRKVIADDILQDLYETEELLDSLQSGDMFDASDYRYCVSRIEEAARRAAIEFPRVDIGNNVWDTLTNLPDDLPDNTADLIRMQIGYVEGRLLKECYS